MLDKQIADKYEVTKIKQIFNIVNKVNKYVNMKAELFYYKQIAFIYKT